MRGAWTRCGLALWPVNVFSPASSPWFCGIGTAASAGGGERSAGRRGPAGRASCAIRIRSAHGPAGPDAPHIEHQIDVECAAGPSSKRTPVISSETSHRRRATSSSRAARFGETGLGWPRCSPMPSGPDVGAAGQAGLGRRVERRQRAHLLALGDHRVADLHDQPVEQRRRGELQVGRRVAGVGRHALDRSSRRRAGGARAPARTAGWRASTGRRRASGSSGGRRRGCRRRSGPSGAPCSRGSPRARRRGPPSSRSAARSARSGRGGWCRTGARTRRPSARAAGPSPRRC